MVFKITIISLIANIAEAIYRTIKSCYCDRPSSSSTREPRNLKKSYNLIYNNSIG